MLDRQGPLESERGIPVPLPFVDLATIKRPDIDRRSFFRCGLPAVAGAMIPYWSLRRAAADSKNDRLHIALVGCGGRGRGVAQAATKLADVVALCDVDRAQAETARTKLGIKADIYSDYRELLARSDIDAVINATPDHWHTAINVATCRAGKDLYAEKPLTLTIAEGKLLRSVVQETQRVVQVGTQQRSESPFHTAIELVRNGRLGALRQVWVALPYYSTTGGPFPKQPVPSTLDWNMYQGQAPERDYCRQRTHGTFRWWYEYAGGIVTDWGNHHIDIAHWGMDRETSGPVEVDARGMFPNRGKPDHYNTADRFFARLKYPGGLELLYFSALGDRRIYGDVGKHQAMSPEEVERLFGPDAPEEVKQFKRNGVMFIGERGRILVNRGGIYGRPAEELKGRPLPEDRWRVRPSSNHMANFIDCIKNRSEPVSPVRIQHRTVTACHLTNISLRLGRKIKWDPKSEQIVGDEEANRWQRREQRAPYEITA